MAVAAVDPRQIYNYLRTKWGCSAQAAAGILANIQAESGFRPGVEGDTHLSTSSYGLFQHRGGRFDRLKSYAAASGRAWTDWTAQIDFAMEGQGEALDRGFNRTSTDAVASSKWWTIKFEVPANAQAKATQRAQNVSKYLYGEPGPVTTPGSGNAQPNPSQEVMNIPPGGTWYFDGKGGYVVAFPVMGEEGSRVKAVTYYRSATAPPKGTKIYKVDGFNQNKAKWVDGGTTDAFRGVPAGKTYQDLVDDVLMQLGLAGSDALKDQGVIDIIALAMTRELSAAELSNRLRQTKWYQSRTDAEREWNDLSQAEKDQRTVDEASKLASMWFTYVGEDLSIHDFDIDGDGLISVNELKKGNQDLFTWAQNIASGKASQAQAVNSWMKEVAGENPDSPWSRTIREEQQAQGQHGVDLANMEGELREMYQRWGIPISDQTLKQLANQVVMNEMAIEDVEKQLDTQASALYGGKPPGIATRDWAQPYMETYMRTLEAQEPDIFDPLIQRGLTTNENLADFNKRLRADERWLETDNARVEMNDKVSALGRVMGF